MRELRTRQVVVDASAALAGATRQEENYGAGLQTRAVLRKACPESVRANEAPKRFVFRASVVSFANPLAIKQLGEGAD